MKEVFDKLTSYNVFNYLLPGVLFVLMAKACTRYDLTQESLVLGAFVYYFVGLVISRIGSLALEPVMKRLVSAKTAPYTDFIAAAKADPKIEVLSEQNNMYRTLAAMGIVFVALKGFELLCDRWPVLNEHVIALVVVALVGLFVLSYVKQSTYISNRITAAKKQESDPTG